jgi:chondroitin AC lyase
VSGSSNWVQNSGVEARVNGVANTTAEVWLISSPVNMTGSTSPQLSFDYKWQFGSSSYNFIDVLVSTNYSGTGNPNLATWVNLSASAVWATGSTYTNSGKISLTSYSSASSLYIGFRMKSTSNSFSTRNHYLDNVLITASTTTYASDIDVLYQNLYADAQTNPSVSKVKTNCTLLLSTGAFSDINYSSGSNLVQNCTRLNDIASAYTNPSNGLYRVDSLKTNYYAGLSYWVKLNQQTSNWWDRHINYTMNLWKGMVLMSSYLKTERPGLLDSTMNYLLWGYQQNNYMEAANGVNKINGAFPAIVVQKNVPYILRMKQQMIDHVNFQNVGEGIEADYMYGAHSDNGRQAYLMNYGAEFISSVVWYFRMSNSTFAQVGSSEITQFENFFINGVQWPLYRNANDPSLSGRYNQTLRNHSNIKADLTDLISLNTPQNSTLSLILKRMNYQETLSERLVGNRMFWRFDYMIHRRTKYFCAHRLSSTRCVGGESGNGDGNYNYYNGSGVNYIYRTGKELSDSLFKYAFNYRQYPGITVEQDTVTLPKIDWGAGGANGNAYAGGASDGDIGAMGFKYVKRGVYAYKSTFFFDGEIVALGAGITRSSGTNNIYTTINQCKQKGTITYKIGSSSNTLNLSSVNVSNVKWIWQDSILYVPLNTANMVIKSESRSYSHTVFTAAIDHGLNPTNASYAYKIKPDIGVGSSDSYVADTNLQVVQNDTLIQAVTNYQTGITQAVFYKAGNFKLKNGLKFTVNQPCVMLYKPNGSALYVTIANPYGESNNPDSINVVINKKITGTNSTWDGVNSRLAFRLPKNDYAGQAVVSNFGISVPLPVEFLTFEAKRTEKGVLLNWSTFNERDCDFFEIQASSDGTTWNQISMVVANNISNSVSDYSFLITSSVHYHYFRIKEVDHDGSFNLSKIYYLNFIEKAFYKINNKLESKLLEIQNIAESNLYLSIFDINGKEVYAKHLLPLEIVYFDTEDIEFHGIYTLRFYNDRNVASEKLLIMH